MQANLSSFIRIPGLLAGAMLAFSSLYAAGADSPSATDQDAFPVFDNFITFTGRAAWVTGDKAAFQTETKSAKAGSGGIENFQLNKDLSKDVHVNSDGHALAGSDDYLAHFNITKDEVGSIDAGYKRFRTFYDGIGGFFPGNNAWMPLPGQDLHVDRAKFWVEGMVNLPDKPVVTLRYTNELRDGRKDSTIWGDTDLTGIPISSNSALNPVSADRKIVPAYLQLGERHQTLEGLVKHTVGKTTYELSLVGDRIENLDTRYINRYPGEVKPFPAIPANPPKLISATQANNAIYGFDQQGIKANTLAAVGKFETILSDKATVHGGLSYQHSTSDITGYRPLFVNIATAVGFESVLAGMPTGTPFPPGSYQGLTGGSKVKDFAANLGADLKATNDLSIETAVKAEERFTQGNDAFTFLKNNVNTATGAVTSASLPYSGASRIKETSWTPEIGVRYTGIPNVALYGNADYRYSPRDQRDTYVTTTTATSTDNAKENHGHYTLGANWIPCSFFTLRGETFYKDHQNSSYGYGASLGGQYILGYQLYGGKLTAIVKPLPTLSFTTRYILQAGRMDLTDVGNPNLTFYPKYNSMDTRIHQIGETVDWTPIRQFYLQANVDFVFNTIHTAYPQAGGTADDVLRNADNNYWTGSVLAGYALDKKTDLESECSYYRANNYQLLPSSQPYGAGVKDYRLTAGLKYQINEHLIASGKIGYLVSRNDTTGGFTDYTARVAYLSLEHAF